MQGTWVQSLGRELRSHMPQGIKKEKKNSLVTSSVPYLYRSWWRLIISNALLSNFLRQALYLIIYLYCKTTGIVLSHDRDNLTSLIYLLPKYMEGGTFYVYKVNIRSKISAASSSFSCLQVLQSPVGLGKGLLTAGIFLESEC